MPKISFAILIFFLGTTSLHTALCQDPVYSQFYNAPLQLNPAFAGTSTSPIFTLNYRNQWPQWPKAYNTYSVSYNQFFEDINSGLGFSMLADNAGDGILKTINASAVYAYRMFINPRLQMKFGLEASFSQLRLDWDKLIFFDQLDPGNITGGGVILPSGEIRPQDLSNSYFDISTGILLYSPDFYVGLTIKHLAAPGGLFLDSAPSERGGIPIRLSVHFGTQINLESSNNSFYPAFISPNVLFVKQSVFSQLNVGANFGMGPVVGGAWFRHVFSHSDAAILSLGFRHGKMKISYSFDLTISQLALSNGGGSHELGMIFNLGQTSQKKTDYNDCFSIFR